MTGVESYIAQDSSGIRVTNIVLPDGRALTADEFTSTVFEYPLDVDSAWSDVMHTSTLDSHVPGANPVRETVPVFVRIGSLNDTVKVPAATYRKCIRVDAVGELFIPAGKYAYQTDMTVFLNNSRWYARGVGLVKELQEEKTDIRMYPEGKFLMQLEAIKR